METLKTLKQRLHELFDYHPDGYFIRRIAVGFSDPAGAIVLGSAHPKLPYLRAKVDGKDYYMHQLVYAWHHGIVPAMIDHEDRNKQNNRIGNLRPSNYAHNGNNRGATVRSTTGVKGVFVSGKRFVAQRAIKGKINYLGTFDTVEQAAAALEAFDNGTSILGDTTF